MARYVILEHDHPFLHWDLMLEHLDALRTWRLLAVPADGADVRAEALGDHHRMYLDYEGPVGGGRGRVACWDRGVYTVVSWSADEVRVQLSGGRTNGLLTLARESAEHWRARLSFGPIVANSDLNAS